MNDPIKPRPIIVKIEGSGRPLCEAPPEATKSGLWVDGFTREQAEALEALESEYNEYVRSLPNPPILKGYEELFAERDAEAQSHRWATDPLGLGLFLRADIWLSAIADFLYDLAEAIAPDED